MIVVVAGGSGMIGTALTDHLLAHGHQVRRLVRRPPSAPSEYPWDPDHGSLEPAALDGADAVVNLAGTPVSARWTRAQRARIRRSRVAATSTIARVIARTTHRPALIQGSAIGYYGPTGDRVTDERDTAGSTFLAQVCAAWEAATLPARRAGGRVAFARTGIVLAPGGGALGRLLPLVRAGLGGRLGPGTQWWSWITLEDEVAALCELIESSVEGPVNLTAPNPAHQADVVRALARAYHRPAIMPTPAWALRLAVGGFAGEILASQRVVPLRLQSHGFVFAHPEVSDAAAWVAGTPPPQHP